MRRMLNETNAGNHFRFGIPIPLQTPLPDVTGGQHREIEKRRLQNEKAARLSTGGRSNQIGRRVA